MPTAYSVRWDALDIFRLIELIHSKPEYRQAFIPQGQSRRSDANKLTAEVCLIVLKDEDWTRSLAITGEVKKKEGQWVPTEKWLKDRTTNPAKTKMTRLCTDYKSGKMAKDWSIDPSWRSFEDVKSLVTRKLLQRNLPYYFILKGLCDPLRPGNTAPVYVAQPPVPAVPPIRYRPTARISKQAAAMQRMTPVAESSSAAQKRYRAITSPINSESSNEDLSSVDSGGSERSSSGSSNSDMEVDSAPVIQFAAFPSQRNLVISPLRSPTPLVVMPVEPVASASSQPLIRPCSVSQLKGEDLGRSSSSPPPAKRLRKYTPSRVSEDQATSSSWTPCRVSEMPLDDVAPRRNAVTRVKQEPTTASTATTRLTVERPRRSVIKGTTKSAPNNLIGAGSSVNSAIDIEDSDSSGLQDEHDSWSPTGSSNDLPGLDRPDVGLGANRTATSYQQDPTAEAAIDRPTLPVPAVSRPARNVRLCEQHLCAARADRFHVELLTDAAYAKYSGELRTEKESASLRDYYRLDWLIKAYRILFRVMVIAPVFRNCRLYVAPQCNKKSRVYAIAEFFRKSGGHTYETLHSLCEGPEDHRRFSITSDYTTPAFHQHIRDTVEKHSRQISPVTNLGLMRLLDNACQAACESLSDSVLQSNAFTPGTLSETATTNTLDHSSNALLADTLEAVEPTVDSQQARQSAVEQYQQNAGNRSERSHQLPEVAANPPRPLPPMGEQHARDVLSETRRKRPQTFDEFRAAAKDEVFEPTFLSGCKYTQWSQGSASTKYHMEELARPRWLIAAYAKKYQRSSSSILEGRFIYVQFDTGPKGANLRRATRCFEAASATICHKEADVLKADPQNQIYIVGCGFPEAHLVARAKALGITDCTETANSEASVGQQGEAAGIGSKEAGPKEQLRPDGSVSYIASEEMVYT